MTDDRINEILGKLTLEQKASLCSGSSFWLTEPIPEAGVPAVRVSDGPNGVRKEKTSAGTNVMKAAETATCYPTLATLACSWDEDLAEEVGAAIGEEAANLGVSTILGPGVNIKRSPLCGRNFEYFSEDPLLAGRLGAAYVKGLKSKGVGCSVKHFCANNQETLRMSIDTVVDERALREIYLPAFEHIVKTQKPRTVMCSYNRLGGTYLSDNKRLLNDILRGEWGFDGIVVSDWGAVNDRVEGVKAGLDLEMPGCNGVTDREIVKAVRSGAVSEEELDAVARRMLGFIFESVEALPKPGVTDFDKQNAIAAKAAAQSAVLLKNDGAALPLAENANVAVIGAMAKHIRYQGGGSSHINTPYTVSFCDAMRAAGKSFAYADGYDIKTDIPSLTLIKEACDRARGRDAVILFIGLTDSYETEGKDRRHLDIPLSHVLLLDALSAVSDNIIVVLSGGAPVKLAHVYDKCAAMLDVYLPGQAGGTAAYDLLYGKVNPSGKLAETFPYNNDSLAAEYFPMGPRAVEYRESVFVGYRYYDTAGKAVRFPFGYGLSYTDFEYSDLKLSSDKIEEGEPLTVTFTVKNTGSVAGAEVAQVYVSDVESTLFRPKKELKGFKKVFLQPGESAEMSVPLDSRAFSYWNVEINGWHVESGDFKILVGSSSRDIRLTGEVFVESAAPDAPIPDYTGNAPSYYAIKNGSVGSIPKKEFYALAGAEPLNNLPFEKGGLDINNTISHLSVNGFGKAFKGIMSFGGKIASIGTENPEMIKQTILDMPLRGLTGFSGGIISKKSAEGIIDICNGVKGGVKKMIGGFTDQLKKKD